VLIGRIKAKLIPLDQQLELLHAFKSGNDKKLKGLLAFYARCSI